MRGAPTLRTRCAIYTRVSTEHGLDQEFNSLHAQREACEAFVASQKHEGWTLLPRCFDDGGFSGGSLERPGIQALLREVRLRLIDTVVVYKVDRLTRSLADFAKLVELFDQHGVSFVSVTQAFNTTSSMGRLTLNVLLSFAQFEREVTGERIRDKIAASKRKGIWMGGQVPLGYRVEDRKLLVREVEAVTVRLIFERYLALGSLPLLQADLRERGLTSRMRPRTSGERVGGGSFSNGALAHLLRNRVYLGEINHREASYPGEHEAIVPVDLFEAVQRRLCENRTCDSARRTASQALLQGRLFDDRGNRMTPVAAKKNGAAYRYYVSCVLAQGRKKEAGSVRRVSAPEIEAAVLAALRSAHPTHADADDRALIEQVVSRIELRQGALVITRGEHEDLLTINWSPPSRTRRREIVTPGAHQDPRPIRAEARQRLVVAIAKARLWLDELVSGAALTTQAIAEREGLSERSVRMTLSLAFLAPDLVQAAIEGTLPRQAGLSTLSDPALNWDEQRANLSSARIRDNIAR
jgi:site-specific DNA recombinase